MLFWLGIVGAPLAFLANLSLNYALVAWACHTQHHAILDAVALITLLLTTGAGIAGWVGWRGARAHAGLPSAGRELFMAELAVCLAALSTLAVAAQWATRLAVSPCIS